MQATNSVISEKLFKISALLESEHITTQQERELHFLIAELEQHLDTNGEDIRLARIIARFKRTIQSF